MGKLTTRQREIAGYVAQGLQDKEIARELCLSIHTVRWHLREAKRRTRASRVQLAVAVAVERALIDG